MRLVNRSTVLFLGSIVSLGLVACGGDDGGGGDDIDPAGTNSTFVVSKIALPTNATEATALGLDIDEKPNDGVDNQLGTLLASIRTLAPGLNLQMSIDEQVDSGGIVLLSAVKATDLTNASGVGMWVYQGDSTMITPPACTDTSDTVCRKHLTGTGMFVVKAGTQTDAKLAGNVMAGTFKGGPGTITLQIALSAGAPIALPLQKAKAEIAVSANGFAAGSKLGGAISQADIDGTVNPAIHSTVTGVIDRDCTGARTPPSCGCTSGSSGASVLSFLDTDGNCDVTQAEVTMTVDGILTPDIDLNGDTVNDAVSLGVGVSAVKGTFAVPAQ